jgi:Tol biopolymer transport system component
VTRAPGPTRPRASRASRDPYGLGPVAGYIGPFLAVVALIVVAALTVQLMNGQLPFQPGTKTPGGNGPDGLVPTPAPSNVVITPPDTVFDGTITYAKAGNIWIQNGTTTRQVTNGGNDSMPTFSIDGAWIYFIRIEHTTGKFPTDGNFGKAPSYYDLFTPILMRVKPDGTGEKRLLAGRYKAGSSTWFYWLRQPTPSPDGKTVTVISDGPNPLHSDIVVKSFSLATKQLTSLNLPESLSLGHQDPAWRRDGRYLLYVRNGRDGTRGAPQIFRYDPATKKARALTGPGYLAPSWSPDGRFIAATKTDSFGTDIAILDAAGTEVLRVTDDSHSFSPVWSPAGDAIAFLHLSGTSVDLRLVKIDASSGRWVVTSTVDLTTVSGLDGTSRPSWFIPGVGVPGASPSPGTSGLPSGSASGAP